jgi:hypothetical protein
MIRVMGVSHNHDRTADVRSDRSTRVYRAGSLGELCDSTANTTDRRRLSCDVRFQPANDPVGQHGFGEDPTGHTPSPRPRTRRGRGETPLGLVNKPYTP